MNKNEATHHGLGYASAAEDFSGTTTATLTDLSGFIAFAHAYAEAWDRYNSGNLGMMTNVRDAYTVWQESGGRTIFRDVMTGRNCAECYRPNFSHKDAGHRFVALKFYVSPGDVVRVMIPHSEVCMHMRVAGKVMSVKVCDGFKGAQLLNDDGTNYSFPITMGEAAFYTQDHKEWYYYYPNPR